MKTRMLIVMMVALLGIIVLSPWIALSEESANNMEIVREKIRADKKLFIAENMGLTESEAQTFWPVYDRYQQELKKLWDREIQLIDNYAKVYQSITDAQAKSLLDAFLANEGDYQKLRMEYLPQFRRVLSEVKVARYFQLENKVEAVVNFGLAATIPLIE